MFYLPFLRVTYCSPAMFVTEAFGLFPLPHKYTVAWPCVLVKQALQISMSLPGGPAACFVFEVFEILRVRMFVIGTDQFTITVVSKYTYIYYVLIRLGFGGSGAGKRVNFANVRRFLAQPCGFAGHSVANLDN